MTSKLTSLGTATFAMLMVCTCAAAADDKTVFRVEASCSIPVVTNRSSRIPGVLGPTAAEKKAHEEAAKLRKTLKRLFDVDFDATNKVFDLQSANWSSIFNILLSAFFTPCFSQIWISLSISARMWDKEERALRSFSLIREITFPVVSAWRPNSAFVRPVLARRSSAIAASSSVIDTCQLTGRLS